MFVEEITGHGRLAVWEDELTGVEREEKERVKYTMAAVRDVYVEHVEVDGRMVMQIRGDHRPELDPYAGKTYPMCNARSPLRAADIYHPNWVNIPGNAKALYRYQHIRDAFDEMGYSVRQAAMLLADVCKIIGADTYTPEWNDECAMDHLENIEFGVTKAANRLLAMTLEDKIVDHFKGGYTQGPDGELPKYKPLRMMDLGVGTGDTTMAVLDFMEELAEEGKIPSEYTRYLKFYLVDVSQDALDKTVRRIVERLPELRDEKKLNSRIDIFCSNFSDLKHYEFFNCQPDSIDMIYTGAAICHLPDVESFFEQMYFVLAKGGVMHAWDYYNGPSWGAPTLRLSRDNTRRSVFTVEMSDGRIYAEELPEHASIFDMEYSLLFKALEDAKKMSVVFEVTDSDMHITGRNFATLLGVLGYIHEGRSRMVDKVAIDHYLMGCFDKGMTTREGFNYLKFLEKTIPLLDNPEPFVRSPFGFIESYGRHNHRFMEDAGFVEAKDEPLLAVYDANKERERRKPTGKKRKLPSLTNVRPSAQIMITTAKKETSGFNILVDSSS
jgi:SAM-dependent methyltransferase